MSGGSPNQLLGQGSASSAPSSFAVNPFGSRPTRYSFAVHPWGSIFTGAASSPALGNSAPSTPAFGYGGSWEFGSTRQADPFGSTGQPSQLAFGNPTSTAFGSTSTAAFGVTSTPAFGSSVFGASTMGSAFGSSSTPAFRATASAFGTPIASSFGASSSPAVGASGTSLFNFSSSPTFGQSSSTFGSTPFGSTNTAFGAQNSTFGTRVANYTRTTETETGGLLPGNLESISAMPVYKDKSHGELRWEDYHLGDKGGPAPPGQSFGGIGSNANPPLSNAFSASSQFGQTVANNLFSQNNSPFGNSSPPVFTPSSNPFTSQATQPFGILVHGGSRVASYTATTEVDSGTQLPGKLESISAMPVYEDKSHEELRWGDYQLGDKGGGFCTTQNAFPSPFSSASTSAFPNSSSFGLGTSSSSAPSLFSWPRTQPPSGNLFGQRNHPAFGSSGTSASGFFSSTPSTSSANTINVSISVEQLTTDLRLFVSLNGVRPSE